MARARAQVWTLSAWDNSFASNLVWIKRSLRLALIMLPQQPPLHTICQNTSYFPWRKILPCGEMSNVKILLCSVMTLLSLTHYEMRCSGNGLKQSVLSGQIHQQVNFHNPRRAVIGRETTNSEGGTQVAAPVTELTWPLPMQAPLEPMPPCMTFYQVRRQ